jgi:hypothetical protein
MLSKRRLDGSGVVAVDSGTCQYTSLAMAHPSASVTGNWDDPARYELQSAVPATAASGPQSATRATKPHEPANSETPGLELVEKIAQPVMSPEAFVDMKNA